MNLIKQKEKLEINKKISNKIPFQLSNHEIGCILESYIDVIEFRGYKEEGKLLLEIASRLK